MKYNFDEIIDRKNTGSIKWDLDKEEDILPMWVADMDFKTAQPIINAIKKRVEHGIFGYASVPDQYYEAEINWWKKRHNFEIKKDWIEPTTGVIPSLSAVVQAFTNEGDKVLIQSPVYNYFNTSITNNKCEVLINNLIYSEGKYEIDTNQIEDLQLNNDNIIRFIKTIKVEEIKPTSISLGNSRAEIGYDPEHKYFLQPSFNLAVSGGTLYESRLFLEHAIRQGNVKQVLLVADWIMFNNVMKKIPDFESYFSINSYSYLFSLDMLKYSVKTIKNKKKWK